MDGAVMGHRHEMGGADRGGVFLEQVLQNLASGGREAR